MYVDGNTLIWCGSLVGAIAILCGFLFRFVKWVVEQKERN